LEESKKSGSSIKKDKEPVKDFSNNTNEEINLIAETIYLLDSPLNAKSSAHSLSKGLQSMNAIKSENTKLLSSVITALQKII